MNRWAIVKRPSGSKSTLQVSDYDQFKRVRVALDTIEWDGGLDLDPEFVYAKCKTIAHA